MSWQLSCNKHGHLFLYLELCKALFIYNLLPDNQDGACWNFDQRPTDARLGFDETNPHLRHVVLLLEPFLNHFCCVAELRIPAGGECGLQLCQESKTHGHGFPANAAQSVTLTLQVCFGPREHPGAPTFHDFPFFSKRKKHQKHQKISEPWWPGQWFNTCSVDQFSLTLTTADHWTPHKSCKTTFISDQRCACSDTAQYVGLFLIFSLFHGLWSRKARVLYTMFQYKRGLTHRLESTDVLFFFLPRDCPKAAHYS